MKIKVSQLEPNPFRDMELYPIDEARVDELVNSINETGFWNNVLVRPYPAKKNAYQIAYGHHRLLALIKAKGPDAVVDLPVLDLDDDSMLRIMAEENNDVYAANTKVIIHTVATVLARLKFLKKLIFFKKDEERKRGPNYPMFVEPETGERLPYDAAGAESIVSRQIAKWIGANWKPWKVEAAVVMLEDMGLGVTDRKAILSKEAVEALPMTAASKFGRAVRKAVKAKTPLTMAQQVKAAKSIVESGRSSADTIIRHAIIEQIAPIKKKLKEAEDIRELKTWVKKATKQSNALEGTLAGMVSHRDALKDSAYATEAEALMLSLQCLVKTLKDFTGGKNEFVKMLGQ